MFYFYLLTLETIFFTQSVTLEFKYIISSFNNSSCLRLNKKEVRLRFSVLSRGVNQTIVTKIPQLPASLGDRGEDPKVKKNAICYDNTNIGIHS